MRSDKGTTRKYSSIQERDAVRKQQQIEASRRYKSNPKNKEKIKESSLKYREKNKDSCIKRTLKWQAENKDRVKNNTFLRKYGISLKDFNEKLRLQNNGCKICGSSVRLVVDHCHITNKVRDILCDRCNVGIGCFSEDINRLYNTIEYLRFWNNHYPINNEPAKDGADPLGR